MGFVIECKACNENAYVAKPSEAETFMAQHASHAAGIEERVR